MSDWKEDNGLYYRDTLCDASLKLCAGVREFIPSTNELVYLALTDVYGTTTKLLDRDTVDLKFKTSISLNMAYMVQLKGTVHINRIDNG